MKSRTPRVVFVTAVALSLGSVLFPACAGNPTCHDYGDCRAEGGSSGNATAGKAGRSGGGLGGNAGQGGMSGVAGEAGGEAAGGEAAGSDAGGSDDGGTSGAAGSAGAPPCNGECGGATPVCDLASNECVECGSAADCTDRTKPFCDRAMGQCVMCLTQADCRDPAASTCSTGMCVACTADADCSDIAGKGVCDEGTCVQCTGKKFGACGSDAGTPLVCDSLKRACTTIKQRSAGLCAACITDAQCKSGQACVLDKFGTPAIDVGHFCHWKKGDVQNGAPADCFATGKPYAGTQVAVTSIDGEVSDICGLRTSTCIANNQFSAKDCTVASTASDAACGFAPPKDAKCTPVPASSSFRCTMTCLSDEDCPGSSCDTGSSPRVCVFN